jgi:hypothetical protein
MPVILEVTPLPYTHCDNVRCSKPALFKVKHSKQIKTVLLCRECLALLQKEEKAHIKLVKVSYINEELPLLAVASHNPEHEAAHPDVKNFREPETQVQIERKRRSKAKSNKEKLNALRDHLNMVMHMFHSKAKIVKYNTQTFYVYDGYAFTESKGNYTAVYKVDKKGKFSYLTAD